MEMILIEILYLNQCLITQKINFHGLMYVHVKLRIYMIEIVVVLFNFIVKHGK